MKLTVLDGANCIGGNKIHLETGGVGFLLDFGLNYSTFGRYYEEFLQPRGTRGICDLLALDLIPRISNLYRDDLHPDGFAIPNAKSLPIDALLVSHAHMDHTGHISLLKPTIPVYASGMTAVIMKAIQDCGQSTFDKEIAYISPRQCANGVIKSVPRCPKELRNVVVTGQGDVKTLNQFWLQSFSSSKIVGPPLEAAASTINGVEYHAYPVDHSILGATAFSFKTDAGWVVYSGDLRLHGNNGHLTREFVKQAKSLKPRVLIVEGTNANGKTKKTEADVLTNCLSIFDDYKGKLVVADFGPRNIERLITFRDIARQVGRRLVITAKDAFLLYAMHQADPSIPDVLSDTTILIFEEVRGAERLWERDFIQQMYAGKYINASAIRSSQGDYILAFSFWDISHLIDIAPASGAYIYSSCEAFSEEMQINTWRLSNWLRLFKLDPIGFKLPGSDTGGFSDVDFIEGYHSSGHISGPELMDIVREIEPEIVVPIHTENRQLFVDELGSDFDIIQARDGQEIILR
ncbi:MAG: MBL fold metallo-hydrolase RNA specificity domain-containing protein [Candidatus Aquicultor sp.]